MDNKILGDLSSRLKHTLSLKRTRVTLYIVAVLWVAVATQMVMNRVFKEDFQITDAFVKSDTEQMQSSLEIAAELDKDYLSEEDKRDIIYNLADSIGVIIDKDIEIYEEKKRIEFSFLKKAKYASTEFKLISIEEADGTTVKIKHYIIARLNVLDGIKSIDQYKKSLEKAFDSMEVSNKQITLKYEGNKEGNLSILKRQEIAKELVNELQGDIAYEYDEGDIYTVYAYTGMINEFVITMGNKINVQIAITYNEINNKTKITLATPILNDSW